MVLECHREKVLATFDPAQAEAVTTIAGPVVVLGGPGTGKTAVVVERAAHLIASGVPRDRILVLGLSRRSMAEMTARLVGRLATDAPTVTALHSLALGLVRRHYREAGYRRPPQSLAGQEAWRHLKLPWSTRTPLTGPDTATCSSLGLSWLWQVTWLPARPTTHWKTESFGSASPSMAEVTSPSWSSSSADTSDR